jgi:branched-chain amino acid aminotransferase
MAPGAISNVQNNGSDVDLTATAIDHKMEEAHAAAAAPASNGQKAVYQELDASKLTYSFTQSPLQVPEPGVTANGNKSICTDHMLVANWSAETGWSAPEIKPYGPFMLSPTASVLHYATECFEGMKAYRGHDGKLRLFRPDCNAERLLMSSVRISLPSFPPSEVEKLVKAFMAVDGPKWLPRDRPGSFIYIRPTLIGTHSQLGVAAPAEAMLFIIASYMPQMDAPAGGMRLHTSPADMVRAWAGGFGYAKVGANYGPSLLATSEAKTRGFHQILWLYGEEGLCTEAGASNFFVLWKNKDTGRTELVTAPLGDKIILDGVTRRSVLQLVRERCADEIDVVERKYTIDEVLEADAEGRLVESFASGTAVSFLDHFPRKSLNLKL